MASNLFSIIKEYFTPDNISALSKFTGLDDTKTGNVISSALPVLLAGIVKRASDIDGAEQLLGIFKANEGTDLNDLTGLLSGSQTNEKFTKSGTNAADLIFGKSLNSVKEEIAKSSGVDKGIISKLLPVVAGIVMSLIGKEALSKEVTTSSGITSMLSGLMPSLKGVIPAGLAGVLGLENIAGGNASDSATEETETGGIGKILLPLLAIAAILGVIYVFSRGCSQNEMATKKVVKDTAKVVEQKAETETSMPAEWLALGEFTFFELISGDSIKIPELGVERKLLGFIMDSAKAVDKETWFSFDRILFETDKAELKPESMDQIKSISAIMKAFPNVELKIGGYTDDTGDPKFNQKLSNERAAAVMNAIIATGISSERLASEGYGAKHPVAENSTEEGRAKNRRIDVRVTKK